MPKISVDELRSWGLLGDFRVALDARVTVRFSNYGGRGTAPVGSNPGIGFHGLYDMAGNVKEWVWNATDESESRRYILGGAWSERSDTFLYPDARSPWDRSSENGFRTVKYPFGVETVPDAVFRPLCGMFASLDEIAERWRLESRFTPAMSEPDRERLHAGWRAAVARVRN